MIVVKRCSALFKDRCATDMGMVQNCVKILDKKFSDMSAGDRMLISSPSAIAQYIRRIPKGVTKTLKEMRLDLAQHAGADQTCPLTTGIFLRQAIERELNTSDIGASSLPFWRVVDEKHPLIKKLGIAPEDIAHLRAQERT